MSASGTALPPTETKWAKKSFSWSGAAIVDARIATRCAPRTRIVASSTPPIGMFRNADEVAWAGAADEASKVVPDAYTPTVAGVVRAPPDAALSALTPMITITARTSRTTPCIGSRLVADIPQKGVAAPRCRS